MVQSLKHAALTASVVLAAAVAGAPAPSAAQSTGAPDLVLVSGEPLARPVVIADPGDIRQLLAPAAPSTPSSVPLSRTPALRLALFTGPEWRVIARDPLRWSTLRPEQADRQALYYPASPRREPTALLWVAGQLRPVSDSGLAVLRRYEVPVFVLK